MRGRKGNVQAGKSEAKTSGKFWHPFDDENRPKGKCRLLPMQADSYDRAHDLHELARGSLYGRRAVSEKGSPKEIDLSKVREYRFRECNATHLTLITLINDCGLIVRFTKSGVEMLANSATGAFGWTRTDQGWEKDCLYNGGGRVKSFISKETIKQAVEYFNKQALDEEEDAPPRVAVAPKKAATNTKPAIQEPPSAHKDVIECVLKRCSATSAVFTTESVVGEIAFSKAAILGLLHATEDAPIHWVPTERGWMYTDATAARFISKETAQRAAAHFGSEASSKPSTEWEISSYRSDGVRFRREDPRQDIDVVWSTLSCMQKFLHSSIGVWDYNSNGWTYRGATITEKTLESILTYKRLGIDDWEGQPDSKWKIKEIDTENCHAQLSYGPTRACVTGEEIRRMLAFGDSVQWKTELATGVLEAAAGYWRQNQDGWSFLSNTLTFDRIKRIAGYLGIKSTEPTQPTVSSTSEWLIDRLLPQGGTQAAILKCGDEEATLSMKMLRSIDPNGSYIQDIPISRKTLDIIGKHHFC